MLPASIKEGFHELLDILVPKPNGPLVILKAYFDASLRPQYRIFSIAGFAFSKVQVKKFDKQWWALFRKYGGCHMKDLAHRLGPFAGISQLEQARLVKSAVDIINGRISFGVALSCHFDEMRSQLPRWIQGFEGPYPAICHLAIASMARRLKTSDGGGEIAYFFEAGDRYSGAALRALNNMFDTQELKNIYLHASHSFIGKERALALQAADMLAWEHAKFIDETCLRDIRAPRKSFLALMNKSKVHIQHLHGASLSKWARQVEELGLAQIEEEKAEAAMKRLPSGESA